MTLLWADGFEGYGTTDNYRPRPDNIMSWKYSYMYEEGQVDLEVGAGYNGGDAIEFGNGVYGFVMNPPADLTTNNTLICGIRIRRYQDDKWTQPQFYRFMNFMDGTANGPSLKWSTDSCAVYLADQTTPAGGSSRCKLERLVWHYIEMKVVCHNTNGSIEVRVNGCPIINVESVNTRATGSSNDYLTRACIGRYNNAMYHEAYWMIDDYYVADGAGSTNNDFLGPVVVETLFPDGDDSVNFSTNTPNAHYRNVGWKHALDTTDYNEDNTSGNRDIFTLPALSGNMEEIHGVVGWVFAKAVTTNTDYSIVLSSNGTETESANITANTSGNGHTTGFIVETDPDTSNAWTPATINALKFGYENK